jgi:hypothetical protein
MISSEECFARYGDPASEAHLVPFNVPFEIRFKDVPTQVYCNKDLVKPLAQALRNIVDRGLVSQLYSWDGCFALRRRRSSKGMSLHAWGLAVDVNYKTNLPAQTPSLSAEFVQCWKDAGFDWGGDAEVANGSHFQLAKFPED